MEVLLREPVQDLGIPGDVVRVTNGYARNYLLPQGLAVLANEHNKREVTKRKAEYQAQVAARTQEIEARVSAFAGLELRTRERADEKGSLYGSVNAARIAELLARAGHPIEERAVRLAGPIKSVGTHEVVIHVHEDRNVTVTLIVEAEESAG